MYDLIIIGLGPAGISAAIYAKRSNLNILVIERNIPGGALNELSEIDNYLGYSKISGPDLAMNFYKQFKSLDIKMVKEDVINIQKEDKYHLIKTNTNEYKTKAIIIATGRGAKKIDLPNNNLSGISYCVLCDGTLYKNKNVALYGNKPKVLEDAIYLSDLVNKLYLIVNENNLIGPKELKEKVNNTENIEIFYNSKIIKLNGHDKIESININKEEIKIDGLFINNEFGPSTSFCSNLCVLDAKGYIMVNEKQETKVKGIYACGDSTKKNIYQIITAASEGATASINAYKYIKEIE